MGYGGSLCRILLLLLLLVSLHVLQKRECLLSRLVLLYVQFSPVKRLVGFSPDCHGLLARSLALSLLHFRRKALFDMIGRELT